MFITHDKGFGMTNASNKFRHYWLHVKISDKGKGFDITSGSAGLGLRGMKERANSLSGDVKVISSQGAGTTIEVELYISGTKS